MKKIALIIATLLTASVAHAQLTFTWTPSTPGTNPIGGYNIYNTTSGSPVLFNSALIPTSDCTATLCTWTGGTTPSGIATFYCEAVDTSGNSSSPSNTATYNPGPAITTSPATAITGTTATLNGSVNPEGLATTAYFQWGTSSSFGSTTSSQSIGSGTTSVTITANLTGLTAGTTYYFRVVGTNSTATNYGATATFTAAAVTPPSAPSNFMFK
jgi:hypothetical protein